ncbi:MAG: metallophosphoesterase [Clostridia bacterium]|nr:metallophosphoesterase [Clostridia bacterium]
MLDYNFVCAVEEADFLKRILPYTVGSPKKTLTCDDAYKRANILFFSDSHIDFRNPEESIDNLKRTIDFANSAPFDIHAVVNTGDAVTPFGVRPKSYALERLEKFFAEAKRSTPPFIFAKGNHDTNDWNNFTENVLDDNDWSNIFYDYAEEKYGIVREIKKNGSKSTWHYRDIEDMKIRIISVDVQDTDKTTKTEEGFCKYYGGKSFYISDEQLNWIAHTALDFSEKEEKDWGVIVAFHQIPEDKDEYPNAVKGLFRMLSAFNKGERYKDSFKCETNGFFDFDLDVDFGKYGDEEKKPHVICCLIGHFHEDRFEVIEGINTIKILNSSCTDCCSDARVARIPATATQNCFSVLNIDTKKRKIRLFRYGAGVNCYGVGGDMFIPDGLDY